MLNRKLADSVGGSALWHPSWTPTATIKLWFGGKPCSCIYLPDRYGNGINLLITSRQETEHVFHKMSNYCFNIAADLGASWWKQVFFSFFFLKKKQKLIILMFCWTVCFFPASSFLYNPDKSHQNSHILIVELRPSKRFWICNVSAVYTWCQMSYLWCTL